MVVDEGNFQVVNVLNKIPKYKTPVTGINVNVDEDIVFVIGFKYYW